MDLIFKVCDICGRAHGQMREYKGKVIGSLSCWRELWLREWTSWETSRYRKNQPSSAVHFSRAQKFSSARRPVEKEEKISSVAGD